MGYDGQHIHRSSRWQCALESGRPKRQKPRRRNIPPAEQLFITGRTGLNSNPHRESTSVVLVSDPAETLSPCSTKLRPESAMVATWNITSGKVFFFLPLFLFIAISLFLFAFSRRPRFSHDRLLKKLCCWSFYSTSVTRLRSFTFFSPRSQIGRAHV